MGAVLRAVEVPERGGDTVFADMGCAYDNLPPELRDRIDDLRAVHSFVHVFGYGMSAEKRARMLEQYPPVEHPVVRTHPETGRKTLFVNSFFTERIVGVDDAGERVVARPARDAGDASRVAGAPALGAGHGRDVGQPGDTALRVVRLLPPAARDGTGLDQGRSALLSLSPAAP